MDDTVGIFILVITILVISGGLSHFLTQRDANNQWERDAIERDLGLYCPNTGEFAFKGECGD